MTMVTDFFTAPLVRARAGVVLLFVLNGLGFSNIVIRYPLITERLGISNSLLGLIIALGPAVGILTGLSTSTLIRRFGAQQVAVWSNVVSIAAMMLVLNAPNVWCFALGLVCMSTFDVFTDISMNIEGLVVQRLYGRSIINSFHGWWSVGALCGGGLGSLFASIELPLWAHSLVVAAVALAINLVARRLMLPDRLRPADPDSRDTGETARRGLHVPRSLIGLLVAIGLVGALGVSAEDASNNWSALYLHNSLGVDAGVAGLGFTALMAFQMLGRFTGDAVVNRLGDRLTAQLGCGVSALVWVVALAWPSVPMTLVAFALTGWGSATVAPATYYAADNVAGLRPGDGMTVVNWVFRLAFLIGPPLIGRLSDLVSLRWALLVVPAAMLGVLALSGVLAGRHRSDLSDAAASALAEGDRSH